MAERTLDVRSGAALLRHRWRLLLAGAAAGAVLGLVYAVLAPIELTSTSIVQVQGAAQSPTGGGTDIDSQVRLVQSRSVLERAGRAVRPALSATAVGDRLDVEAVTAQLIEIRASSPRAAEAQALSRAVAGAYVGVADDTVPAEQLTTLREREARLFKQLADLQAQIDATKKRKAGKDPTAPEAVLEDQLLAQLTAELTAASLRWDEVKKELTTGGRSRVGAPLTLVQPATPAVGSSMLSHVLTSVLTGAVLLGVLVAVGLLLRARRDPRVRTRDDLADAVGSTVLGDVRSRPQRSVAEWSALFRSYEAPAVDAWAFRQVLRSLAAPPRDGDGGRTAARRLPGRVEHPRSVTLVTLAGDLRGMALGPQLASFAASLGITTRFVVAAGHSSSASLQAACSSDGASHLRAGLLLEARIEEEAEGDGALPAPQSFDELLEGPVHDAGDSGDDPEDDPEADPGARRDPGIVWKLDDDVEERHQDADDDGGTNPAPRPVPGSNAGPSAGPVGPDTAVPVVPRHVPTELTVLLVVADRRSPALRGLPATAATVLAISPEAGNREELARLAVAVDETGRRIDGIIVADPDPADATTGRRTLDLRALETPLPLRTTGVSQLPVAGADRGKGS